MAKRQTILDGQFDIENNPKTKKDLSPYEVSLYFSSITFKPSAQRNLFGGIPHSDLSAFLASRFQNAPIPFTYKKKDYVLEIYEQDYTANPYCFGAVMISKDNRETVSKIKDKVTKTYIDASRLVLEYYSFFYIDIAKGMLIYLPTQIIQETHKILSSLLNQNTLLGNAFIAPYIIKDFANKIKQFKAIKRMDVVFNTTDKIMAPINDALFWGKDGVLSDMVVSLDVKNPSRANIDSMIERNLNSSNGVKKAVIHAEIEDCKNALIDILAKSFCVKSTIGITQDDIDNQQEIKNKIIAAADRLSLLA